MNNDKNAITVSKVVNALMKVIHSIELCAKNFKRLPWKRKPPYLEVIKYIQGGKYLDVEFGKYLHAVRE